MTEIKVILSVDAISTSVNSDNTVIGTSGEENKIEIDNIVGIDDVTADDTTDDQHAISDLEEGALIEKSELCPGFENEDNNVGGNSGSVLRRKKHRRGRSKKRKWKPYTKLTWEEKTRVLEKESLKAQRLIAERLANGKAVAPYNTTQFLIEDHNALELCSGETFGPLTEQQRERRESGSGMCGDDFGSLHSDEEEYLQKEFCQVYQHEYKERLNSMSKVELISGYMILEDRVEALEDVVRQSKEIELKTKSLLEKINNLEETIKALSTENEELKRSRQLKDVIDGFSQTYMCDCLSVQTKTLPSDETTERQKEQMSTQLTNSVTNSVESNSALGNEADEKKGPALVMDSESNNL